MDARIPVVLIALGCAPCAVAAQSLACPDTIEVRQALASPVEGATVQLLGEKRWFERADVMPGYPPSSPPDPSLMGEPLRDGVMRWSVAPGMWIRCEYGHTAVRLVYEVKQRMTCTSTKANVRRRASMECH